jgi:Nif-specific regulatory protein
MIHESESDTTVRRFDLSQQFTAMQRISVVLSRATEASKTLQEVLSVLHNDAFMQHGMICLYDSQQEILSIEALQQTENQTLPGSTQIRYRPGKGWLVPCWPRGSRWCCRASPTISVFSTA